MIFEIFSLPATESAATTMRNAETDASYAIPAA